jgi:AcrR family transcriptional regulator
MQNVPYRIIATMTEPKTLASNVAARASARGGRPRSDEVHRKILDAARDLLTEDGFADLRLEHVAARAGVGKATIYRRWDSKEALAAELLAELAGPHIAVEDSDDTRRELLAAVVNPMRAVTETSFGPVIRALLSQIAINPTLGDPFRASVVQARRDEVARVVRRGIARGDLRPDADVDVATELLVGPVYFRLMFGGMLTLDFANRVVDNVLRGYGAPGAELGRPAKAVKPTTRR